MFKLPFTSNAKKTVPEEYFGLLLKEDKANCFLIKKNHGHYTLVDEILITYSNGWESLTEDVDEALSLLEQRHKVSLKETIIYIYSHFVDENSGKIKKVYFDKIKSLLKNLELHPLGYIECYEGIVDNLSQKEGLIVNLILLELDLTQLTLFIFKNGKKIFSTVVPRTENIINDIIAALANLKEKILLPSRILLYNSGNLSNEAAEIISYHWTENYFIQPPKVEVMSQEKLKEQLLIVFEKQIKDNEKPLVTENPEKKTEVVQETETEVEATEVMGFQIGKDVGSVSQSVEPVKSEPKFKLPKLVFSFSGWQKKIYLIFGLVLIAAAVFANEYFLHKADLIVYLPSQKIEKEISIEKNELKIATFSGEVKITENTSGKKDIGDKAKGEVTVYNYDDQVKTFSKGTEISVDSLKYVFDADIKIDPAKIAEDMAKLPGKAKVQITAAVIGPEYNLEKGKKFKVADTSYFAINESALIGGSKKTIKTVAKNDLESLKVSGLKKAKEDQNSLINLSDGDKAITDLTEVNLGDIQYSKEVGEEADNVNLVAKSMVTVYYYQNKEMLKILQEKISDEINSGFKLTPDQINFQLNKIEKNTINLSLTAKAIKDVKEEVVAKAVVFKNKEQLEEILKKDFSSQELILKIKEPLPILNNFTSPFIKNNTIQLIGS